jgi:multidrug efflux system outer membrane protein
MIKSIPHRNRTLRSSLGTHLAGLFLILPLTGAAQEIAAPHDSRVVDGPLTLRDCIAIALGESPKLEASRFDLLAATAEIRAEQGKILPELTGSAEAELFSGNPTGKFTVFQAGDITGIGATKNVNLGELDIFGAKVRYPIFKDGSIFGLNHPPAVAAKKAEKEALAWTTHLTREEVIYRITDAFIATVSAQNREGFVTHRVGLLEQSVAITQEQQKQGLALPIDLKLAKDQLNGAQSLSKLIHQQVAAGRTELAKALALPSSSSLRLSSTLPEPPQPPGTEQLLNGPLHNHPSLQMQRATIEKAKQEYRLERFRLYPSVTLDGSALYVDDFNPPGQHVYTGAIAVSVPIFDFGAQSATARAKKMTYLAEQARLASVADDVIYEIVKIYEEIGTLTEGILSRQQEVAKGERDWRVASSQQQQGITEPLKTNEAELYLIGKRDELTTLEARRLLLYAALQKATGGAWKWIP